MYKILGLVLAAVIGFSSPAWAQGATPAPTDMLTVAVPFEPQTLDPMASTTDLVALITGSVLEPLYGFDAEWRPAPVLAAALPELSADGKTVTIALRQGVPFHNGAIMTSADVVASLERWLKLSPRGQVAAKVVESVVPDGDTTVTINLSQPFAPLLPLLSFNTGAAVVFPEAIARANMDAPITGIEQIIGTGAFKLAEHVPDQFVRLTRFDGYVSSDGMASGFGGAREALVSEVRYFPVPDANTRLATLISGQYDIVLGLSPETYLQISRNPELTTHIIQPSGWLLFVMNTKDGPTSNEKFRQAVQTALNHDDIMLAAYGSPDFFSISPSLYAKGTSFYSEVGAEHYNQHDLEQAKSLLAEAGYNGEPFRLLTSQQYDFVYKSAIVAADNLRAAGINVELVNLDWATMLAQRQDSTAWESFISFFGFVPEPSMLVTFNPTWFGWWDNPEKAAALADFTLTVDPAARAEKWAALQKLLMEQAPNVQLGAYSELVAASERVKGLRSIPFLPIWNVSKQ